MNRSVKLPFKKSNENMVSVVIPTYNREEVLCDTLKYLFIQKYHNFEIIVVDQSKNHSPETLEFLKINNHKFKYFLLENPNAPAAKNYGAEKAEGDILLFLDDDIVINNKLLEAHARNYEDLSIGVVAGRVLAEGLPKDQRISPVGKVLPNGEIIINFHSNQRQVVDVGPGGNWSMRKALFLKAGGFDERFAGNAMKEESDLALRMKKTGAVIIFDPEAEIFHLASEKGGTRSLNRLDWYEHFFHNELLFFLKNRQQKYLPLFFWAKSRAIMACMFFYGKANPKALIIPLKGFIRAYQDFKN